MNDRRRMNPNDWINTVAFVAMGIFFGLALDNLMQLDGIFFWVTAISMPILFFGVIGAASLLDWLFERVFPSGLKPARKPAIKQRRPVVLLASLPAGILIGLTGAQFGLGELLL